MPGCCPATNDLMFLQVNFISMSATIPENDFDIDIQVRLLRSTRHDVDIEETFLLDPEPETSMSSAYTQENVHRFREAVIFGPVLRPASRSEEVTFYKSRKDSEEFDPCGWYVSTINIQTTAAPKLYTSTLIICPNSRGRHVSTLEHQISRDTKCWSVSDIFLSADLGADLGSDLGASLDHLSTWDATFSLTPEQHKDQLFSRGSTEDERDVFTAANKDVSLDSN